ncbi:hypothetical protein B0H21DRAFT_715121 [Amylocystis lapponica]|nr:hypothetical protein B0H21DRAFT_715121 [Amylocystis lapponica]
MYYHQPSNTMSNLIAPQEEKRNAPAPQRVPVDHEPGLEITDEERSPGFNLDKLKFGGDTSHLVPPQEKAQPSNITAPLDTDIVRLAALANQPSLKVNQVQTQDELAQIRQISSSVRSGVGSSSASIEGRQSFRCCRSHGRGYWGRREQEVFLNIMERT